jgi:hypothetical protein
MGAPDSQVAPAMNAAIFLMLGFVGLMFAGLGSFIFCLARRANMPPLPTQEFHLEDVEEL